MFGNAAPDHVFKSRGVSTFGATAEWCRCSSSGGEEGVVAEARALSPVSIDVHPVALKEIFLEAVSVEN